MTAKIRIGVGGGGLDGGDRGRIQGGNALGAWRWPISRDGKVRGGERGEGGSRVTAVGLGGMLMRRGRTTTMTITRVTGTEEQCVREVWWHGGAVGEGGVVAWGSGRKVDLMRRRWHLRVEAAG